MLALLFAAVTVHSSNTNDWVVYEGEKKNGKHIVFLAGDEEYRSEEGLPQMAKILAFRHGFKCTVLFSVNDKGEIDPDVRDNQPGLENLKTADLVVMALRFRQWPDEQMKHFDEYVNRGKPIIALRTSTHAFDLKQGPYERYGWQSKTWPGGFGKQVLGETWVSHWGVHGKQATRGAEAERVTIHPILNGVSKVFGTSDVYEAHLSRSAMVLMWGEVVAGMNASDPPATGRKKTATGREQDINDPMMPILWLPHFNSSRVVACTMGAATDFLNEGLRLIIVNAAYWQTGLEVPEKADVTLVGEFKPSNYGFGGFKKGVKPSDLATDPG